MSDLWVNIRFGVRHLQIGPRGVTFRVNHHHYAYPPATWCEVFEFFWWSK